MRSTSLPPRNTVDRGAPHQRPARWRLRDGVFTQAGMSWCMPHSRWRRTFPFYSSMLICMRERPLRETTWPNDQAKRRKLPDMEEEMVTGGYRRMLSAHPATCCLLGDATPRPRSETSAANGVTRGQAPPSERRPNLARQISFMSTLALGRSLKAAACAEDAAAHVAQKA